MSIQPISSTDVNALQSIQSTDQQLGDMRKQAMEAAAKLLGISVSDLQSALKNGQTLDSLAQAKGIDKGALAKAISDAISKANPAVSAGRAELIALRMIDGPGQGSGHTGGNAVQGAGDRDGDGDGR